MIVLRVPYPMGFYAKGFDGRIDDPECRLERPRAVGGERRPDAVAEGRRQGHQAVCRALPAAAGSAGEVVRHLSVAWWPLVRLDAVEVDRIVAATIRVTHPRAREGAALGPVAPPS